MRPSDDELVCRIEEAVLSKAAATHARCINANQLVVGINLKCKDIVWVSKPLSCNLYTILAPGNQANRGSGFRFLMAVSLCDSSSKSWPPY